MNASSTDIAPAAFGPPIGRIPLYWIGAALLVAYAAFIPVGSYPVFVFTYKLDWLLSIALFGFGLLYLPRIRNAWPVELLLGFGLFALANVLTACFSKEQPWATIEAAKILLYVVVTLTAPLYIHRHLPAIRLALVGVSAGLGLWLVSTDYQDPYGRRFALPRPAEAKLYEYNYQDNFIDPNITHVGMLLPLILWLPDLLAPGRRSILTRAVQWGVFGFVLVSSMKFTSRTAMLGFGLGLGAAALVAAFFRRTQPYILSRMLPAALAALTLLAAALVLNANFFFVILERLGYAITEARTNEFGRLLIYQVGFNAWIQSPATMLFGTGGVENPHNEFFRALVINGVAGLAGFCLLIGTSFTRFCLARYRSPHLFFAQNALFFYLMAVIITYWQTKVLWISLAFLCATFLENRWRSAPTPVGAEPVREGATSA